MDSIPEPGRVLAPQTDPNSDKVTPEPDDNKSILGVATGVASVIAAYEAGQAILATVKDLKDKLSRIVEDEIRAEVARDYILRASITTLSNSEGTTQYLDGTSVLCTKIKDGRNDGKKIPLTVDELLDCYGIQAAMTIVKQERMDSALLEAYAHFVDLVDNRDAGKIGKAYASGEKMIAALKVYDSIKNTPAPRKLLDKAKAAWSDLVKISNEEASLSSIISRLKAYEAFFKDVSDAYASTTENVDTIRQELSVIGSSLRSASGS